MTAILLQFPTPKPIEQEQSLSPLGFIARQAGFDDVEIEQAEDLFKALAAAIRENDERGPIFGPESRN